jgi:hypothetical protein
MMKRLSEETSPEFASLASLVTAVRPGAGNPFVKRLLRLRIARVLERSTRPTLVRPALFSAAVTLCAATSGAAAGYAWLKQRDALPLPAVMLAPSPQATPDQGRPAEHEAPPQSGSPDAPGTPRAAKRLAGEDPSQVALAVRALRWQGEPARAQALLDDYLKTHPRGALAEDALALAMEAAALRKDPRAMEYARRYLSGYPSGRFRGLAERLLPSTSE